MERAKLRNVLASLTTLCLRPALFETLVIRLSAKLDSICAPIRQQEDDTDVECDSAYAYAILMSLHDAIQQKLDKKHVDIPKYAESLGESLFWVFIRGSTAPVHSPVMSDARVVRAARKIVSLLVRSLASEFSARLRPTYNDFVSCALTGANW